MGSLTATTQVASYAKFGSASRLTPVLPKNLIPIASPPCSAHDSGLLNDQIFRSVVTAMAEGILIVNRHGRLTGCNASAERILGVPAKDIMASSCLDPVKWRTIHEDNSPCTAETIPPFVTLRTGQPQSEVVLGIHRPDGTPCWISLNSQPLFKDGETTPHTVVCSFSDITERKEVKDRLQFLTIHDALTSLPNRALLCDRLNHALTQARRHNGHVAVLFIDLDRFKNINDTLGHQTGDKILQEVAERLKACLRSSDTVARQGGDEFVILIESFSDARDLSTVAQKILSVLSKPFWLDGHELYVGASIGISTYPKDGNDVHTMMKNADTAMYRAKEQGKNNYQFYSSEMNVHHIESLALESGLRRAVELNEFLLHYQSKLDLRNGRIIGMEALIRWGRPDVGIVSPVQFIPMAEETGLITPIGEWALKTACAQNKAWQKAGLPPLRIAVNLSARQFMDETLLCKVAAALEKSQLSPQYLELEITESMIMQNADKAVRVLQSLKQMGIYLSIDDFGTGYSSLAYLKRFPIDCLKIDRSFIQDLPDDSDNAAIAQAIIAMAHSLKIEVLAEGVETQAQLDFLRRTGCDQMQGYLFSKPLPDTEFANLLKEGRCLPPMAV